MSVAVAPRRAAGETLEAALLEMLRSLVARAPLFAELRARGDADDVVQDALIAVTRRMARGDVDDPFAYATTVVQNLARRAYVRPRREVAATPETLAEAGTCAGADTQVEQRFELAEVLEMVRAVTTVVHALPAPELELVRCELRRDDQQDLARRLGMSRRTFYRRKREVLRRFVAAVADGVGNAPCAEHAETLLAAAGGSGFAGARRTREHAADCAGCGATLRRLTAARHGLAVLAPLPALDAAVDASLADRVGALAAQAGDWVRALLVRAPDPAAMLPSTRGAAAAVAAACLGVGGTTYCAVDGVPAPVLGVLGADAGPRATTTRAARAAATAAPTPPVTAVAPPAAATATPRLPRATAARRAAGGRVAEFARSAPAASAHREFRRRPGARTARAASATTAEFGAAPPAAAAAGTDPAPAAAASATPPAAAAQEFGGGAATGAEFGG